MNSKQQAFLEPQMQATDHTHCCLRDPLQKKKSTKGVSKSPNQHKSRLNRSSRLCRSQSFHQPGSHFCRFPNQNGRVDRVPHTKKSFGGIAFCHFRVCLMFMKEKYRILVVQSIASGNKDILKAWQAKPKSPQVFPQALAIL